MTILLAVLMLYAACGLVLSLAVHLLSFFGAPPGGHALFIALHVGIFPLWLPVVLLGMRMTNGWRQRDIWKIVLAECPPWMKYMTYGFFIYAIINFVLFIILGAATTPTGRRVVGAAPTSVEWHGFSGHWMAFYAAGLAVVTAAYRRGLANLQPTCPNGHGVSLGDKFCPSCGAAITTSQVPGHA